MALLKTLAPLVGFGLLAAALVAAALLAMAPGRQEAEAPTAGAVTTSQGVPAIDAAAPEQFETATFALG